ncbi:MAG TPA: phosphomannomutase/phosphoglucomutase [Acidiferrobacterales bacterium]|nr:phosphomannomutase/phosphoglucomutase [Acidiferrobacterales bacterium]
MNSTQSSRIALNMNLASLPAEIFKPYDIRGIVGQSLTPAIVERIGHAIGSEARDRGMRRIAIARDGRLSGPELSKTLAAGITNSGCDVIDIGRVPTPVLYFAAHHLGTQSGVVVTGSHNPPDYNGIKMVLAGETLAGEAIQKLRQRLLNNDLTHGKGSISQTDVQEAYLSRITGDVKLARPLRVIVDCGNGVAGELAPQLLRRLGCEVRELFCDVDGRFPNHHPDPSQPKNLADLIMALKNQEADIGLAFDGDGDRLGVVSPEGTIIWPDRQMILYARDVLARNPGTEIIYDVKCSRTLPAAIVEAGGKATIWKTGHSFIKAKLKESGALLAGEMSGHIFFKERWYGFDDGLYTAARLLELLSHDKRDPAVVFAALPNTVNTPELQLKLAEGEHYIVIEELIRLAHFPDARVTTIDGLRADFADGFGLVRASNTTPVLVFRFEAESEAGLKRIQDLFRALIARARPDLTVPF